MKIKLPHAIIILLINIPFLWYLLTPTPQLPPLPQSVKSELPGDTVQITNVQSYFTDLRRADVISFYKSVYTSPFRIIVNHPPEKAKEIFLSTTQSYYIEEFIIPFKESIYINGFEWQNDVFTKPDKRIKNKLAYQDIEYYSKVTVRTFPTSIPRRLLAFFSIEALIFFLYFIYRQVFKKQQ